MNHVTCAIGDRSKSCLCVDGSKLMEFTAVKIRDVLQKLLGIDFVQCKEC